MSDEPEGTTPIFRPLVRAVAGRGLSEGDAALRREWIVANGLGGYASATLSGLPTRKYHGHLVAALPSPFGRVVMIAALRETVRLPDGTEAELGGEIRPDPPSVPVLPVTLKEFRLENGLPVWRFLVGTSFLEKRVWLPHMQNSVYSSYRLLSGPGPLTLSLSPYMNFRALHEEIDPHPVKPYGVQSTGDRFEIVPEGGTPRLRLYLYGRDGSFRTSPSEHAEHYYRTEEERGCPARGWLWTPGLFRAQVSAEEEATLVASTEAWDVMLALPPDRALAAEQQRRQRLLATAPAAARAGTGGELVLTADQFIIAPTMRVGDTARVRARGDEIRTVIAGYHWFTDWGRDTMIALEGLTLMTGRAEEAGYILRTFAQYVDRGLIPNMFPEGKTEGRYNTADATLWFFHAIDRYLLARQDEEMLRSLLPVLRKIVFHHIHGTRFGIGVDPADGLLRQGDPGWPLTWMDAKVGDWVVTPRRGKPVEINALWYNALNLMRRWLEDLGKPEEAQGISSLAGQVFESFNRRFWFEAGGYLYDVVDGEFGDDASLRPNQLFAVSLPFPVLDSSRWAAVVDVVEEKLLTPLGLRSLAPEHPDYKMTYAGDLWTRDAAYHQGTVWSWLLGHFVDAWLRTHPGERARARDFLKGLVGHLDEAGLGSVSEVFDGDPPFRPGGCISQAWSVAELLRSWVRTGPS